MEKDYGVFGDVLAAAKIGSWKIEVDEGKEPRMYGDATMMHLLGLEENADLSPEAFYHAWYDNVDPDHYDAVAEGVGAMANGQQAEIQYPWHHPDGRTIIVRCGGVRDMNYMAGTRVVGIHQWVTYLKHVDRKLEEQQRQLKASLDALEAANRHEQLRADALDYVMHNEDLEGFINYFSQRVLEVYGCDQVLYRDIEGRKIVKDRPGAPHNDFSQCADCPHFAFESPAYADGFSVVDDSSIGYKGFLIHPKCPVRAALTWLVYEDEQVFGYIALHNLSGHHRFTEDEKSTFDRIAKLLSLVLSRRKRRNELLESLAFTNYFVGTFVSTYYVNLETRTYKVYKRSERLERDFPVISDYLESLCDYINRSVHPDDRATLTAFVQPGNLKSLLREKLMVTRVFRDISGEQEMIYRFRAIRGADENNVGFAFEDITDEVKREQEQREERQRQIEENLAAERANKAKSYFFSTVSHDIRTPLNAIIGYAELLKLGIADEAERKVAVDSLLVSGHALLELINDVLDLSKLEAGKMEICPEPVDVVRLVEEVAKAFRVTVGNKSLVIQTEVKPMPWLKLDPHRVRQILFNLVGNAVKFTEKGFVEIKANYDHGTFRFVVHDTGCGISEEDQLRIAQPYIQVGSASNRGKGTGLGLAICKQLVARMGGEIELQSEQGKGTTFTVVLSDVEEEDEEAHRARLSTTQRIRLAVKEKVRSCHRVLVVDDQPINRTVLKIMLARFGIQHIFTAENGKDALKKLGELKDVDLVLTDMWMPELDGEGLVRQIRKTPALAHLPVYAVTADVEAQKDYDAMGFSGILLKPITLTKLKDVLG